jgi:hypothetical protein
MCSWGMDCPEKYKPSAAGALIADTIIYHLGGIL